VREVGTLENQQRAQLFADFLLSKGVNCELDQNASGDWQVWVLDDKRFEEASALLVSFEKKPDDVSYAEGAKVGDDIRSRREKEERAAAKMEKTREDLFRSSRISRSGVVTLSLIALSVIVSIACKFGENTTLVQKLSIADVFEHMGRTMYYTNLAEVRAGQVWRLVTPIFMHFGFMHILFNMMWMMDLGNMVEKLRSSLFLILFVVGTAVASNLAQYFVSGPYFGGMSGVVYGLLGYVWMQSKFNPWSAFVLHKVTVQMMMIWLVLGFTGIIGHMANYAHLGGLVAGVVWGFIDAKRSAGSNT